MNVFGWKMMQLGKDLGDWRQRLLWTEYAQEKGDQWWIFKEAGTAR
jgi:hypothetical protein